jgi:hypothetical protein
MRLGPWATAASVALAVAIAPGAVRLLPGDVGPVERPAPLSLGAITPSSVTEVAMTPPGELVGEVAAPTAPAPTFEVTARQAASGEVFALIIGIDDYPGTSADLGAAVADADAIDAALHGFGVPAGNRVVLRDGQARRADVEAAVRGLAAQGGPDATLVLAYAGHVRKVDRDTEELVLADGGSITDAELASLLAPARAQHMWFLLATCFAGGFTELMAPGRVLTGAADADSLAYESPELRASFLVHYLIHEAWLAGSAGPSVQAAFAYADARLARDHPERRPVQLDQHGGALVLGSGDPAGPAGQAPSGSSRPGSGPSTSAPPRPTSPTTTTTRPRPEDCLLGVVCAN